MSLYQFCLHVIVYSAAVYCLLIWLAIVIAFVRAFIEVRKEQQQAQRRTIKAPTKVASYEKLQQSWENN